MDWLYLFKKNEFFPNKNVNSEETLLLPTIFVFKIESASKYFFCRIKFSIVLISCEKEYFEKNKKKIIKYLFNGTYLVCRTTPFLLKT